MNNFISNSKCHFLFAIILYAIITLLFTYPVVLKMNSEIPKWGSDVYQAVAHIDIQTDLLKEQGLFKGLRMLSETNQINIFFPYAVLNLYFNQFAAYNLMFFLSFFLSGLGAYCLAFYFTKNKLASFLAGVIFAFSPFHIHQSLSVNIGTMHQEWLPFFVLYLFKFFEKFQLKYFVLTAVFAFLIAMTEHQLLAFTVLFVAIFAIYKLFTRRDIIKNKKFWMYFIFSALLLIGMIFTLFSSLLEVAVSEENFLNPGIKQAKGYSISFLDPLAPPIFNSLWPNLNASVQNIILGETREKGSYFVGYLVLAIIIYFLVKLGKYGGINDKHKNNIKFWIIATTAFYIFSLGPVFSVGDRDFFLPYYLIYKYVPFYENIRTTGRFFVYAMLGVSILSAFSFSFVLNKLKRRKIIAAIAAAAIILLEFSACPLKTISLAYSPFYDQIATEKENYKLLEIPGSTKYSFASFQMITNNVHKKEIINGMPMARVIPEQFSFQKTTPVIKQLLYELPSGSRISETTTADIIQDDYYQRSSDILNYYNIEYITVSKNFIEDKKIIKNINQFVKKHVDLERTYEDEFLITYEIKKDNPEGFYATLNTESENWDVDREDKEAGIIYRPADSGAKLIVVNMEKGEKKFKITMDLRSLQKRKVAVKFGKKIIGNFETANEWKDFEFSLRCPGGKNEITFNIYDKQGRETITDKRKTEGVLFSNIKIAESVGK